MVAQKGRFLILKLGDGGDPESFTTIAAGTTNAMTINNESVDISNKTAGAQRQLLEGAGITSMSTTMSGVFTVDTQQDLLEEAAFGNTHNNFQIVIPDGASNITYEGSFMVASFAFTGEHNGAVTFEATLESAGDITRTTA